MTCLAWLAGDVLWFNPGHRQHDAAVEANNAARAVAAYREHRGHGQGYAVLPGLISILFRCLLLVFILEGGVSWLHQLLGSDGSVAGTTYRWTSSPAACLINIPPQAHSKMLLKAQDPCIEAANSFLQYVTVLTLEDDVFMEVKDLIGTKFRGRAGR